ncbi:MAG: UbiA family prenyltransferase [Moraxellaceae bacterium]|nr:UbiA family prenyltransferase [Moraxellaceae bacterium]
MLSIANTPRGGRLLRWWASSGAVAPATGAAGALAVGLLTAHTLDWSLALVVWLLIYASYQIDSLGDLKNLDPARASRRSVYLLDCRRRVAALGVAAFLGAMLLTALQAGGLMALSLLVFPLSVAFYGMPWLRKLSFGLIPFDCVKRIPFAKAFYTAFFWGLLGVFSVAYVVGAGAGAGLPVPAALFAFALFALRGFINTAFCDLKDIEQDRAAGVVSLAVAFGREGLLRLLDVANLLTPVLLCAAVWFGGLPASALFLGLTVLYAEVMFSAARRQQMDMELLCNLVADAEWILWPVYVLIGAAVLSASGI